MRRLWYNGKVVSMDGAMTRYEAVGTEGDKLVYLGTTAEALAQSWDEKRDLQGAMVLPGFNDLGTVEPEVARQWHPALNGTLTPELVTAGARRKVWWECDQGHVWKAAIYSRTGAQKCGCPVCAGRVRTKNRLSAAPKSVWGQTIC